MNSNTKTSTQAPLAQSSKSTSHTLNHTMLPTFLPLPPNKTRKHTNPVFFNPITPCQVTTSKNCQSPQVRSLIVQWSLNYIPVHQSVAENSMHLQSTYTQYLQHLSNQRCIWSLVKHLWWSFFAKIVNVLRLFAIFTEKLHHGCSTGF